MHVCKSVFFGKAYWAKKSISSEKHHENTTNYVAAATSLSPGGLCVLLGSDSGLVFFLHVQCFVCFYLGTTWNKCDVLCGRTQLPAVTPFRLVGCTSGIPDQFLARSTAFQPVSSWRICTWVDDVFFPGNAKGKWDYCSVLVWWWKSDFVCVFLSLVIRESRKTRSR